MAAQILDGKKLASDSEKEILESVSVLKEKGIIPTLATILVGDDPASETYVRMKQETCKRVGMESLAINLPKETSTEELLLKIDELIKKFMVFCCNIQSLIKSMKENVLRGFP